MIVISYWMFCIVGVRSFDFRIFVSDTGIFVSHKIISFECMMACALACAVLLWIFRWLLSQSDDSDFGGNKQSRKRTLNPFFWIVDWLLSIDFSKNKQSQEMRFDPMTGRRITIPDRNLEEERILLKTMLNGQPVFYESTKDFIVKINDLQNIIGRCSSEDIFGPEGTSFDIQSYMNFYGAIRLKDSNRFFFSFFDLSIRATPYILAMDRDSNIVERVRTYLESRLKSCSASRQMINFWTAGQLRPLLENYSAGRCVVPEETPMGYLQLLHFCKFGESFFDYHFNSYFNLYFDSFFKGFGKCLKEYVVLSSKQLVEQVEMWKESPAFTFNPSSGVDLAEDADSTRSIPFKQWETLTDKDLEPAIELDEDYCTITWVEAYVASGIYGCKYRISRKDFTIKCISKMNFISVGRRYL